MEEENRKPKALTKEEKKETKKERIFRTKDIVFTAIIAFLIGAIITTAGFAICGKTHKNGDMRNFKQDGIQRNIEQREFNNKGQLDNRQNNNGQMKQRPDMNNQQTPNNNNQSAPAQPNNDQTVPAAPNNTQQPATQNNTNNQSSNG